jgi:PleD family two-component response regulator
MLQRDFQRSFDFLAKAVSICGSMTKPLALVFYERLMPGSQLVNRLQDLGYRVLTLTEASLLIETARRERPMLALVDLVTNRANICSIIKDLKADEETGHIPVVGFAAQKDERLHAEAAKAGATLVAYDDALLPQLPHLLEHALQVE